MAVTSRPGSDTGFTGKILVLYSARQDTSGARLESMGRAQTEAKKSALSVTRTNSRLCAQVD